jgi:serine/threonine protein kinase
MTGKSKGESIGTGRYLKEASAREDAKREPDAIIIAGQLIEGLKIMHKEGFTHRDLKPEVSVPIP